MKAIKKFGVIGLSFALLLGISTSSAFAAYPQDNSTEVTLQADDQNISVTVPVDIAAKINGDGTIAYPTTAKFVNNSVFAVHVEDITVSAGSAFKLWSQTDWATNDDGNDLTSTITAGTDTQDLGDSPAPVSGQWNIAEGSNTPAELALTFAGQIKNITGDLMTAPVSAYTIVWTVAPGALS